MVNRFLFVVSLIILTLSAYASLPPEGLRLALLKYGGGGDWYANPTALSNLSSFCNRELGTELDPDYATVDVGSADLFNYPFVHMTGHGNVVFSDQEADNLRQYLIGGGFLHIDDNYGMDPYVRVAVKKLFPDQQLIELPFDHPVYQQAFALSQQVAKQPRLVKFA